MTRFWPNWIFQWGFVFLSSFLGSCNDPGCIRNSDCPSQFYCQAGQCVADNIFPQDASGDSFRDSNIKDAAVSDSKEDGISDALNGDLEPPDLTIDQGPTDQSSEAIPLDGTLSDTLSLDQNAGDALVNDVNVPTDSGGASDLAPFQEGG